MALSQDSWIFSKEYIDDLNAREVINNRIGKRSEYISRTIWLMEDVAKHLDLERKVVTTAAVYFQRFYIFHSFDDQKRLPVCLACLFLASKVEERPKKLKELIVAFNHVFGRPQGPDFHKQVILAERILLNTLCFELNYPNPLLICSSKMKDLRVYCTEDTAKQIYQSAVNFINDSFRSSLCLQYNSNDLVLSLIFLATCRVGVPPNPPPSQRGMAATSWLDILSKDIKEEIICDVCLQMLEFYELQAFLFTQQSIADVPSFRKLTCDHLGVPSKCSDDISTQPPSPSPSHVDTDIDDYDKTSNEEPSVPKPTSNPPPAPAISRQSSQDATPYYQNTPLNFGETPASFYKQETPSSTPGFSTPLEIRRRERSYSESDYSFVPEKMSRRD